VASWTARVEPVDLHHLQASPPTLGRARTYSVLTSASPSRLTCSSHRSLGKLRCVARPRPPHADVGPQTTLAIGDLPASGVQLSFRDPHAAAFDR